MKKYIYLILISILFVFLIKMCNNLKNANENHDFILQKGIRLLSNITTDEATITTYVKGDEYGIVKCPKYGFKDYVEYGNTKVIVKDNSEKVAYCEFEDDDKTYVGIFVLHRKMDRVAKYIDIEFLNRDTNKKHHIKVSISETNGTIVSYDKYENLGVINNITIIDSSNNKIYTQKCKHKKGIL